MSANILRFICSILVVLTLLYLLGKAIEDTREETRSKIIQELEEWYDNYPSAFCPMRWQVIEAIERAKLR